MGHGKPPPRRCGKGYRTGRYSKPIVAPRARGKKLQRGGGDPNGFLISSFMWTMHGIEPREGVELRKRASVFQRSSQGAQAPQRSVRAARGRDSLPRHLELTRTSAKGSFSFIEGSAEIASRNLASEWDALSGAYFRRACTSRARPLRHSSRFCATLQTVRSSVRTRGYTQNDTFPMQYDAGLACTIRRGQ